MVSPADGGGVREMCSTAASASARIGAMKPPSLPQHVGPAVFSELGRMVAIRAPREFDGVFRQAGGVWEPGSRRWLIERRRVGPVIRALRALTDPLFRRAGLPLD